MRPCRACRSRCERRDRRRIIHGGHEAILELLLGCDADVAQDGAGEFGKEALDEIEPGTVLGSESKFEAVRGLLGNALWTLGARESGTARLEEAVAAYRAALEERPRLAETIGSYSYL
jgi:hypothetical protein